MDVPNVTRKDYQVRAIFCAFPCANQRVRLFPFDFSDTLNVWSVHNRLAKLIYFSPIIFVVIEILFLLDFLLSHAKHCIPQMPHLQLF